MENIQLLEKKHDEAINDERLKYAKEINNLEETLVDLKNKLVKNIYYSKRIYILNIFFLVLNLFVIYMTKGKTILMIYAMKIRNYKIIIKIYY